VIATGGSTPQFMTFAQTAEEVLTKHGLKLSHTEGLHGTRSTGQKDDKGSKWVLLDFGFYNLERVWADAKIIEPK
jgi:ribosomal silencing factor RsfS